MARPGFWAKSFIKVKKLPKGVMGIYFSIKCKRGLLRLHLLIWDLTILDLLEKKILCFKFVLHFYILFIHVRMYKMKVKFKFDGFFIFILT